MLIAFGRGDCLWSAVTRCRAGHPIADGEGMDLKISSEICQKFAACAITRGTHSRPGRFQASQTSKSMKSTCPSLWPKSFLPTVALMALVASVKGDVLYSFTGAQEVNETSISLSPGISRDSSAVGTLYFKYTVAAPASNKDTENYFAGFQFYESGGERLGIGNSWNFYAYSAYATASGDLDLRSADLDGVNPSGVGYQLVESSDTTTIVFRVDYVSGGNDNITVWLNPNLALTEAGQSPSLTTNFSANATFDSIRLREGGGGGGWTFSEIAIAESATDAGFFAAPLTTATWDGEGGDSNWSTAANWFGDTAPTTGFDLVFPDSASLFPVNDLIAGTSFTGMIFGSGASSYVLAGNAIGISNYVRNRSANPQVIEMPMQLEGPLTIEALNSSLYIDGSISGVHGITKTGANRLELTAENTYTGGTSIDAGTLSIGDGDVVGSIDPASAVSFGAGTTTRLEVFRSDDIDMANPIATGGRANVSAQGVGQVNLTGPVTGAGEFWTHGPGTVRITPNAGSAGFTASVVVATGTLEVEDFSSSTVGVGGFFIGQAGSGTLRYTGATASTGRVSAYALQGAGTNTVIEVTSPSTELTFSAPLGDNEPFNKGFTKSGPGTLILAAAQIYQGDTVVEQGELAMTQPGFNDNSTVVIGDEGMLHLDFTGIDTVAGIVLGVAPMGPGTYSEASHPDFIRGSGSLVIPSTDPFPGWIAGFTFAPGADLSTTGDPDGDGITNFEEYAFGLAPNSGASVNAIVDTLDEASGSFSYTRRLLSLTDLTYSVWYSTDLSEWTEDHGAVEGTPVVDGEVETVPVTLTGSLLGNTKLFVQVRAE